MNLFLPSQDHLLIYKQMLFIRFPVPIVRETIKEKLEDVYKPRRKNILETQKPIKQGSNIATHAWLNGHSIDFNNAHVIDNGNFRGRKTLESWHTAITRESDK